MRWWVGSEQPQQEAALPSKCLQKHTVVPAVKSSWGRAMDSSWINLTSHQRQARKEHWSMLWLRYSSRLPADTGTSLPAWNVSTMRTPAPLCLSTLLFFTRLLSSPGTSFHKEHCSVSRSCWRAKVKLPTPKSPHDQREQQQITKPIVP